MHDINDYLPLFGLFLIGVFIFFVHMATKQSEVIDEDVDGDVLIFNGCLVTLTEDIAKSIVKSGDTGAKIQLVIRGMYLEKLVYDKSYLVRAEIANHGHMLDKLIDDPCSTVRALVAMNGYGLTKLKDDKAKLVRQIARDKLNIN